MTETNDEIDDDMIKSEAEILACCLRPLFQRDNFDYLEKMGLVKMNSFDTPALMLWQKVYENLRHDGWTQNEAIAWLQSKGLRWFLDGSPRLFDSVAQDISNAADKKFIADPAEITAWLDTTDVVRPDLFISRTEEDGVKIYSNHPELLGDILVFEPPNDTTNATEFTVYDPEPEKLKGDWDQWNESLFQDGSRNLKSFLESFILKNT